MKNLPEIKSFRVIIGAVLVLAAVLVAVGSFYQSPRFPDSIPSSEQLDIRAESYKAQLTFFNQFTRYIRYNHGGIIEAEEIASNETSTEGNGANVRGFRQSYQHLDKELVLRLTRKFAENEKIRFRFSDNSVGAAGGSDGFEIEFLLQDIPWVRVQFQRSDLYPPRDKGQIQYTETTDLMTSVQDEPVERASGDARLVIIIDDLGNNMTVFNNLIQLDYDITYSILPQQAHSIETADIVHQYGREVMLHQPMQPKDWPRFNPGIGALLLGDDADVIREKMERNLRTVPYAIGVNNHMGSAYTQYEPGLDVMMQVLSDYNLFFLDSKTAPGRTTKKSAGRYGVPYLSRNIFLDNVQDVREIKIQLYKAADIAKKRGRAIAIGHPYPTTYETLAEYLPMLDEQGIQVIGVSKLVQE